MSQVFQCLVDVRESSQVENLNYFKGGGRKFGDCLVRRYRQNCGRVQV